MKSMPNNWDKARKLVMIRSEPGNDKKFKLEPGVKFFVAMLNQIGCSTLFSCEGHPRGFYIMFRAPYPLALRLNNLGYFGYKIHYKDTWTMETNDVGQEHTTGPVTKTTRKHQLRHAAEAWEKEFGELDLKKVKREI